MKDNRIYIILGVTAAILLVFFMFFYNPAKRYSWAEDYNEDKKPYGTHVIYQLLKSQYPDTLFYEIDTEIKDAFPPIDAEDYPTGASYVFVGEAMYWDSLDIDALLNFALMGNDVFISSRDIPFKLKTAVFDSDCTTFFWFNYDIYFSKSATLTLHDNPEKAFEFDYVSHGKNKSYRWNYIDSAYFCDSLYSPVPLGVMNDSMINFFRQGYGGGDFYFHTAPIAFSNIQMLDSVRADYAGRVFGHLENDHVYWDRQSRLPLGIARNLDRHNRDGARSGRGLNSQGPLSYLLSQQALRWAWYTFCVLAVLFLLFRSKRRQRIIPVLEANKNTSLAFINTIGQMHYRKGDHRNICMQKMNHFLLYIREHYHLNTKDFDQPFFNQLSAKSDIPKNIIEQIFLFYQNIKNSQLVSEKTLVDFHTEMEKFYKNCK